MTSSSAINSAASNTPVTGTAANTSASQTNAGQQELASNFTQFLTLLTTQLQNQDPLNPMDSSQFTQQLVEYSQVEQQLDTNSKLDNLTTLSMNATLSLALGYVGKDITYTSAEMDYSGSGSTSINYNLGTASATPVTANITDSDGNVVDTITALDGTAGTHTFTWDGTTTDGDTAPAGTYGIQVNAFDANNTALSVSTAVTGNVRGVESQDGVPFLLVGDRSVSLGNVIDANTHSDTTPTDTADTGTGDNTDNPTT